MAGYTKNASGAYEINYNDSRFTDVKNEQTQKEAELTSTYDNMINNSDTNYQAQIDATKEYETTQSELQQAQTDQQIEQINQEKEQAQADYTKEQKASYVDYMKQTKSNQQNMANSGLTNTGYSESSIVSMYNQYQNRVATAKESLNQTIVNYNNQINQAVLANNEALAEIAYNSLQTQNQLNQQAFEYKNSLITQKEDALENLNEVYYARYQDVVSQINNEIQLQMTLDQIDKEYEEWQKEFELEQEKFKESINEFKQEMAIKDKEIAQQQQEIDIKEKELANSTKVSNAQANYYNAQASATKASATKSSSSDPYSSSNSSSSSSTKNAMSTKQYNNIKTAVKEMATQANGVTTEAGKQGATKNIEGWKNTIKSYYDANKMSKEQAYELLDIINNISIGSTGGAGHSF